MTAKIAQCSYQGGREYNEDSVRRHRAAEGVYAVVVADGLGGHGGGKAASEIAADAVISSFAQRPLIDTAHILDILNKANAEVVCAQTPSIQMKTTLAALFINRDSLIWGHVGDTRLYHFWNGVLTAQTLDHSVSQMAVLAGEITAGEIRHHADRNKVLRALGVCEGFKAEISKAQAIPDGFNAFLLCTDGFWEYVLEIEMELELAKSNTPDDWIKGMVQRIARRAPKEQDNFSAAAVFLIAEDEGEEAWKTGYAKC